VARDNEETPHIVYRPLSKRLIIAANLTKQKANKKHCPPLAACRKYGLPDPCAVVCDAEIKLAEENKVGK